MEELPNLDLRPPKAEEVRVGEELLDKKVQLEEQKTPRTAAQMRTWLPYSDFRESVRCLSINDLRKVRLSCKDILLAIENEDHPRRAFPAVQMWMPYPGALCVYAENACWAYHDLGHTSMDMFHSFERHRKMHVKFRRPFKAPWWLGDATLMTNHRANLVFLDRAHYGRLFPEVTPSKTAWWPPAKKPQIVTPDDVEEEVFD